mgnify:FL=1|jgi:hypothetical protein
MKKMLMIIFLIIIFTVSINPVSAVTEISSVTSLGASYTAGRVSYSGTVAPAVKAAAVLLFDFDGNLIMMDTCEVTGDGTFSGTMEIMLTRSGTYTVKASDYEGGAFTESTFVMSTSSSSDNTDDIPETGDNSNITLVFLLMLLSGVGILSTALYGKRQWRK